MRCCAAFQRQRRGIFVVHAPKPWASSVRSGIGPSANGGCGCHPAREMKMPPLRGFGVSLAPDSYKDSAPTELGRVLAFGRVRNHPRPTKRQRVPCLTYAEFRPIPKGLCPPAQRLPSRRGWVSVFPCPPNHNGVVTSPAKRAATCWVRRTVG